MQRRKDWQWRKMDSCLMEASAKGVAGLLQHHGLIAVVERHSRDIDEEPYVEWTWRVYVAFRNKSEKDLAHLLMVKIKNGHGDTERFVNEYRLLENAYERTPGAEAHAVLDSRA